MQLKKDKPIDSLYGNNIESVKALRVVLPLYYANSFNDQPNVRYYFPETPELNGKTIVGIKCNTGTDITIDPYSNVDSEFDYPFSSIAVGNFGREVEIVGPRGPLTTFAINTDIYLFLTLYNEKMEQIICNYPVHDLAAYGPVLDYEFMGKIRPFDTKINIKSSFVTSTNVLSSICDLPPVAIFTFFYR
jgi:hypothetical protein